MLGLDRSTAQKCDRQDRNREGKRITYTHHRVSWIQLRIRTSIEFQAVALISLENEFLFFSQLFHQLKTLV